MCRYLEFLDFTVDNTETKVTCRFLSVLFEIDSIALKCIINLCQLRT